MRDPGRVFAYLAATDLRKGYDGLYGLVQTGLKRDPLSGELFQMMAMENATKSASDMIHKYALIYNRARQASITKELLEIISGAEALKG